VPLVAILEVAVISPGAKRLAITAIRRGIKRRNQRIVERREAMLDHYANQVATGALFPGPGRAHFTEADKRKMN
jgi:hypothetical protein